MRRSVYIHILLAVAVLVLAACSAQKNTGKSRFWQSFTAKYNTYYNGKVAYIDGALEKETGNKDNFTEQLPLFTQGNKKSRELGKGKFDVTVEKMEKTIKKHSIKARPEWKKSRRKTAKDVEWLTRREYNPFLWKAWLLLGKAQYQKGAFDEAAATFAYMGRLYQTQPMQYALARAWLARCYLELDWLYDAEDVIRNMRRDSIDYRAQSEWDATLADYYLKSGELDKAVPYLRKTIRREKRKTQKAREWFLMGQAQTALGNNRQAYKAYQRVVRQNPPYELEFNARIAQTEVMAVGNAKKMISRLKRMARSDNNKDFLDQVYYAIGNIYLLQKDTTQAIAAYEKGNEKATRSGIEKGVLLLRLGGLYWEMEKYNDAQRCYGEAIGLLDKDRTDYEELSKRSKVLDELVPFTDAIHLQDSLQELAKMSEEERNEAIDRVIEALKKKEKEERDKAREAEVEAAQAKQGAMGNRNQRNTPQQPTTPQTNDGSWYFYNQMAVSQGKQTFQKQWGKRENVDNWQRNNRTVVTLASDTPELPDSLAGSGGLDGASADNPADAPADSLSAAQAEADSLASDPHNREYYLAQIPFTEEQVQESNLIIMDGLYNSGVIFKDKLENLGLAEKQFVRLYSQYPDFEKMDQAWYHLFLLYSRRGDKVQADSCLARMVANYPESEWTVLLNDPYFEENARFGEHIEDSIYGATYDAFKQNRHEEIAANAKLTEERFPLGVNRPKFLFIHGLNLLNQGDALGCVDELKKVVEKYPQSEVTELAGMIVKGVQEGRQLFGGKFDLDDIWSRRDITLAEDSTNTDTLSAERNVPFVFLLVYQPDSLNENQLLYEMARFNFSNFLVRNFDLAIEPLGAGASRMLISGFLNFDEALQYARQLHASADLQPLLAHCRSVVISESNLALMGTRYSFKDYDEFYEQTFQPLQVSDQELLQIPEGMEPIDPEDMPLDEDAETGEDEEEEAPAQTTGGDPFLDDLFF
ncbi:MAG: tetratricopeptide repeat protein [Prevotella sp.]|nr:tetratricopeptide repeat protein [Prevotella sp.]